MTRSWRKPASNDVRTHHRTHQVRGERGPRRRRALAGGLLAEAVPLRATYFITVPFIVAAGVALLRFREPRLHRAEEGPLRQQIAATYRALLERGGAPDRRPAGADRAPAAGDAGVRSAVAGRADGLGRALRPPVGRADGRARVGGLLGGRLVLGRPATVAVIAGTIVGCCVVLTTSHAIGVVIVAQVLLVLVVVAVSIRHRRLRRRTVDDPRRRRIRCRPG